KLSDLRKSEEKISPDGTLTVSVEIENTGTRAGEEVVQLYISDIASSVTRPVKELTGFQRVSLQPGEKKRVEFKLTPVQLGFYDRKMQFFVEPGEFKVMVGSNSVDLVETSFQVVGK